MLRLHGIAICSHLLVLSMISAQTRFRVCREQKPVSTFSDHALETELMNARASSGANLRRIFGIGHRLHPSRVVAIERLLHRDVGHAGGWGAAVPMLFVRRNPDDVAGPYLLHRPALGLNATDTRED